MITEAFIGVFEISKIDEFKRLNKKVKINSRWLLNYNLYALIEY